ncbi:MAG TPA: J domain-containing protein [Pyrinomonadaceae bacterium]|nr:J domain-containing protein [Pyrinomonadaceae bacterium]
MSQFDLSRDYYAILGAKEETTGRDLERLYKRRAAQLHPDRGGSEEGMKSLNEAYQVLKDETTRKEYDRQRQKPFAASGTILSAPAAKDVGLFGHFLSAFLCLLIGFFLLFLVRVQWIWFLWPLVMLAVFVILFGVLMAHSAMLAANAALPLSNPVKRHRSAQEAMFWVAVAVAGYGVYLLLTSVG